MYDNQPPIRTEFLTPTPGIGTLHKMLRITSNFMFGPFSEGDPSRANESMKILFSMIRGKSAPQDVNTGLILKNMYHFDSQHSAIEHFIDAQIISGDVIRNVVSILGLPKDRFGLKDEVSISDPDLTSMLPYTNSSTNNVGEFGFNEGVVPRLRFEQLRELFITDIAMRLLKQSTDEKPERKLSELQRYFNKYLYLGPAGHEEPVLYNYQEGELGEVVETGGTKLTYSAVARQIDVGGHIIKAITNFDTKTPVSQILKLIGDFAPKNIGLSNQINHEFDPIGKDLKGDYNLHDRQRFRFIVQGGEEDIELLGKHLIGLKSLKGDEPLFSQMKVSTQNTDKGQVPTWKLRFKAIYQDVPVEILIFDMPGYLNSMYHYGMLKADSELFDGANHELYEIRRILHIVEYLYPYSIYRKDEHQTIEEYRKELRQYAANASQRIAEKLQMK